MGFWEEVEAEVAVPLPPVVAQPVPVLVPVLVPVPVFSGSAYGFQVQSL